MWLVILLLFFSIAQCSLLYNCYDKNDRVVSSISSSLFNSQIWRSPEEFGKFEIALIALQSHPEIFNWCDVNNYNKASFKNLLDAYGIDGNQSFAVTFDTTIVVSSCPVLTNHSRFLLSWYHLVLPYIQNIGGTLLIENYAVDYSQFPYWIDGGTRFSNLYSALVNNQNSKLLNNMAISNFQNKSLSCFISNWTVDVNPFDELYSKSSVYSILIILITLCGFVMSYINVKLIRFMFRFDRDLKQGRRMEAFILFPEFLNGAVRIIINILILSNSIDVNPFLVEKFATAVGSSLQIFSQLALLFLWYDVVSGVSSALRMKLHEPIFSSNKYFKLAFSSFMRLLIISQTTIGILGYFQYMGGKETIIDVLTAALEVLNSILALTCFYIVYTTNKADVHLKEKIHDLTSEASSAEGTEEFKKTDSKIYANLKVIGNNLINKSSNSSSLLKGFLGKGISKIEPEPSQLPSGSNLSSKSFNPIVLVSSLVVSSSTPNNNASTAREKLKNDAFFVRLETLHMMVKNTSIILAVRGLCNITSMIIAYLLSINYQAYGLGSYTALLSLLPGNNLCISVCVHYAVHNMQTMRRSMAIVDSMKPKSKIPSLKASLKGKKESSSEKVEMIKEK